MKSYEIRVQRLNEMPDAPKIDCPQQAHRYWQDVITKMPWFIPDREICVALTLNTRYRVTGHSLVGLGSLNEAVTAPREVFRAAVAMNSYAVILVHCHPSGDPSPSEADHRLTKRIVEAGNILQILLLDHVIVGQTPPWFSFKEAGAL